MDLRTVEILRQLNNRFYEACAEAFSQTRQGAWEGWKACLPFIQNAYAKNPGEEQGSHCGSGAEKLCRGQWERGEEQGVNCDSAAEKLRRSQWERGVEQGSHCGSAALGAGERLSLFDLACGNGRFEAFLADELPAVVADIVAVDSCNTLMKKARTPQVSFREFDALEALVRNEPWSQRFPACDVAVSFGFFHHIPSSGLRNRVLSELLSLVRPGGLVIVSLWCFLEDERLSRKAKRAHERALAALGERFGAQGVPLADELESGDCFLGWQDAEELWRYCHSFDDAQASELASSVADTADEVARFRADGKPGKLNIYLVLRKH